MTLLLVWSLLQFADASAARAAGDAAYRQQQYGEARTAYLAALELGGPRGLLHYDLGACAYREKEFGPALHHFRLAQVSLPRDGEVQDNLLSVQRRLGRGETQAFQFTRSLRAALHFFTMSELLVAGYAILVLALLIGALHAVTGRALLRRWLKLAVVLVVIVAALLSLRILEAPRAVVLQNRTVVRNEPSAQTESIFTLAEGDEVAVEEVRGDWAKVESEKGTRGWVEIARLGVVRPQDVDWSLRRES